MSSRSSLASALQDQLGRYWPLVSALLVLLLGWPIALFWRQVQFAPERFVEEWIKLIAQGVILFLILEVLRARQITEAARHLRNTWYTDSIEHPIQALLQLLQTALVSPPTTLEARELQGRQALAALGHIIDQSKDEAHWPMDYSSKAALREAFARLDTKRCLALAAAACPAGRLAADDHAGEVKELVDRLRHLRDHRLDESPDLLSTPRSQ